MDLNVDGKETWFLCLIVFSVNYFMLVTYHLLSESGHLPIRISYWKLGNRRLTDRLLSNSLLQTAHIVRLLNASQESYVVYKTAGFFLSSDYSCPILPLHDLLPTIRRTVGKGRIVFILVDNTANELVPIDFISSVVEVFQNGPAANGARIYLAFVQSQFLNEWWPDVAKGSLFPAQDHEFIPTRAIPRMHLDGRVQGDETTSYFYDTYHIRANFKSNTVVAVEIGYSGESGISRQLRSPTT